MQVRSRKGTEVAGTLVAVSRGDGGARTERSDERGVAVFRPLTPGPWQVALSEKEIDQFLSEVELTKFTERTITDPVKLREIILASRRKGYAVSDQELELSLFGIAAPITDNSGRAVAAVTASVHVLRHSPAQITKRILPLLQESAVKISAHLQLQEFQQSDSIL